MRASPGRWAGWAPAVVATRRRSVWKERVPNRGRAFAWSRPLATIDRLTGEIAPRAKQTVRKALGAAVDSRQPAAGYITPFTEMRVGAGVLAIKARRLQRARSIRAARPLLFRRLHRQSTGARPAAPGSREPGAAGQSARALPMQTPEQKRPGRADAPRPLQASSLDRQHARSHAHLGKRGYVPGGWLAAVDGCAQRLAHRLLGARGDLAGQPIDRRQRTRPRERAAEIRRTRLPTDRRRVAQPLAPAQPSGLEMPANRRIDAARGRTRRSELRRV